ncbi:MAG TPA: glucokinase [Hanamia sp.]|nr:glucokinase [Hanamia sp.]
MLPLLFSESNKNKAGDILVLAGDVGATKTNLALFKMNDDDVVALKEDNYPSQQYKSITQITDDFLKDQPHPEACCIGVAGPVFNGKVKLTNLSWDMDSNKIAKHLSIENVYLINDLEATAYGLAMLTDKDTVVIHKGSDAPSGNAAIIAPGTGLGEAGLYFDGKLYHPFATEGGHTDFASRDKTDFELYEYLQNKFGHVSYERLISGPGIFNIYQFLKEEKKLEEHGWLVDEINKGDAAAVISKHVEQSPLCDETMRLFIRFLAHESANLVLKMKATGGLFIGGGIAPQIIPLFEKYQFNTSFVDSGRMNHLLEKVTVRIILNTKTAMLGAAYFGAAR